MSYSVLLICDDCFKIYILYALEDVGFYKGIVLLKLCDQFFCLQSLRRCCSVLVTGCAGVREMTCTLKEM